MPLLDPPNILPNAMFLVCKALTTRTAIDERTLKALMQPTTLQLRQDGANTFDAALRALVSLGIVTRSDHEIRLPEPVATRTTDTFYSHLLTAVMTPSEGPESPAQDLQRMLAWWAAQDPYGEPFDWSRAELQLSRQYLDPSRRPVTNSNPYRSFARWAVSLGFAEFMPNNTIIPDGTRALRTVLPQLGSARQQALGAFLTDLRQLLPVVDGGSLAVQERSLIKEDAIHRAAPEAADVYLTHALLRCQDDGLLKLIAPSDAQRLLFSDGTETIAFSHLEVAT